MFGQYSLSDFLPAGVHINIPQTPHPSFAGDNIKVINDGLINAAGIVMIVGSDKKIYAIGSNEYNNQLGIGAGNWIESRNTLQPIEVFEEHLPDKEWEDAVWLNPAVGGSSPSETVLFALSTDGEIWGYGGPATNTSIQHSAFVDASLAGQLPILETLLTPYQKLVPGDPNAKWEYIDHMQHGVFAYADNGKWYSWGYGYAAGNITCLLGTGCTNNTGTFNAVAEATELVPKMARHPRSMSYATGVSSGFAYISENGDPYFFGYQFFNTATVVHSDTPVPIIMPSGVKALQVLQALGAILILGDNGRAYYLGGKGSYGPTLAQPANSTLTAAELNLPYSDGLYLIDLSTVRSGRFAYGVGQNGEVFGWGSTAALGYNDPISTSSYKAGHLQNGWYQEYDFKAKKVWYGDGQLALFLNQDDELFVTAGGSNPGALHARLVGDEYMGSIPNGNFIQYQPMAVVGVGGGGASGSSDIGDGSALTGTTIDCQQTQILGSLNEGTPSEVTLRIELDIQTGGAAEVTLAGSGLSLKSEPYTISSQDTGPHHFYIPLLYDGTTLGTFDFAIDGIGMCTSDLSTISSSVMTTTDNVINLGSDCTAVTPATISK